MIRFKCIPSQHSTCLRENLPHIQNAKQADQTHLYPSLRVCDGQAPAGLRSPGQERSWFWMGDRCACERCGLWHLSWGHCCDESYQQVWVRPSGSVCSHATLSGRTAVGTLVSGPAGPAGERWVREMQFCARRHGRGGVGPPAAAGLSLSSLLFGSDK